MSVKQSKVVREAGGRYRREPDRSHRLARKRVARAYTVVLRWSPAAARYAVELPAAPNVLTAGTPSIAGSLRRAREALTHHLEWLLEDGESLPEDRPRPRTLRKGTLVETVTVSLPRQ